MMDMMIMYFHQRVREYILFKEWLPTTNLAFVFSCIGIAVLGILMELFKTFRLYLYRRADQNEANKSCRASEIRTNSTSYGTTNVPTPESVCECASEQVQTSNLNPKPYSAKFLTDRNHQIQSILFFIQAFFSYTLMLVAMTYNTLLFVSLIVGHGIGFFFTQPIFTPVEKLRVGDCCCE